MLLVTAAEFFKLCIAEMSEIWILIRFHYANRSGTETQQYKTFKGT